MEEKRKKKAVVVGGSIAGISCAHALIAAGWDVVVLEKTCSPPTGSATGAGLGLDPLAQKIIQSWLQQPQLLQMTTLPLEIDQVINFFFLGFIYAAMTCGLVSFFSVFNRISRINTLVD